MTDLTTRTAGFFRFPARITSRIGRRPTPASWVEHLERSAARERFHARHAGAAPAKAALPALPPGAAPARGASAARITVRV